MTPVARVVVVSALLSVGTPAGTTATQPDASPPTLPVRVRPATLALSIGELAGRPVVISGARVVGMFGPRVLVLDTASRWTAPRGYRDRVLVLVETGEVTVSPRLLVGSPVTVKGTARTLLGMQVAREVPWPAELDSSRMERLDIRAAVLATSVRTLEGIELTAKGP